MRCPTLHSAPKLTDIKSVDSRYNGSTQKSKLKTKNLKRTDLFDRYNQSIQWSKLDYQPTLSADTIGRSNKVDRSDLPPIYASALELLLTV